MSGFLSKVSTWRERFLSVGTLLALNVPLIALILLRNLKDAEPGVLELAYGLCVILGYYVFIVLIVLSVLSALSFYSEKLILLLNGLALTFICYYLFMDSLVYGMFRIHIDLFWLKYIIHDFSGLGLPALSFARMFAALVILAALEWGLIRLARRIRRRGTILIGLASVGLLAFILSQAIHIVAFEQNISRVTSLTPHFPLYMPFTSHKKAVKYGGMLGLDDDGADAEEIGQRYSSLKYPLKTIRSGLAEGERPLNIVVIMLESWRFDAMNAEVTPNIQALADESSLFTRHYSSGNSTTAGIFGMFYGLHPTYWMAVKSNSRKIHNPLLMDLMEDENYAFGVFADSNFKRHKIKDSMFLGIDIHEDFAGTHYDEKDEDLKKQVISFLREQKNGSRPFFCFAFFKSSHYNYTYPDSLRKFTPAREISWALADKSVYRDEYFNDYLNSVHYNDVLLGEIIAELEALDMMDETVIVVTTDHGEEFDDIGADYWGHGSNFTEYQTHVPLVLHYPGREARVVTRRTAHIDIPTTLIQDVFEVDNSIADYSNGANLFDDDIAERPLVIGSYFNHAFVIEDNVYAIYSFYTKKYKLGDINAKVGAPRLDQQKIVMREMGRFYRTDEEDGVRTAELKVAGSQR